VQVAQRCIGPRGQSDPPRRRRQHPADRDGAAKLADLGLAATSSNLNLTCPQQARHAELCRDRTVQRRENADVRCDVYGLGHVYMMVTGLAVRGPNLASTLK
jgi:hypothetical protein